jgi:hypothetical protein
MMPVLELDRPDLRRGVVERRCAAAVDEPLRLFQQRMLLLRVALPVIQELNLMTNRLELGAERRALPGGQHTGPAELDQRPLHRIARRRVPAPEPLGPRLMTAQGNPGDRALHSSGVAPDDLSLLPADALVHHATRHQLQRGDPRADGHRLRAGAGNYTCAATGGTWVHGSTTLVSCGSGYEATTPDSCVEIR